MSNRWTVKILDPLRLDLRDTDSQVRATLLEPIRYDLRQVGTDADYFYRTITVPAGFPTDLASIPRPLWSIPGFSPFDRIARPAVLHDWLYRNGFRLGLTRADADDILAAAMLADGEGWVVRNLVWLGVRAGGGSHWEGSK
jgi:hypothetical protein